MVVTEIMYVSISSQDNLNDGLRQKSHNKCIVSSKAGKIHLCNI